MGLGGDGVPSDWAFFGSSSGESVAHLVAHGASFRMGDWRRRRLRAGRPVDVPKARRGTGGMDGRACRSSRTLAAPEFQRSDSRGRQGSSQDEHAGALVAPRIARPLSSRHRGAGRRSAEFWRGLRPGRAGVRGAWGDVRAGGRPVSDQQSAGGRRGASVPQCPVTSY